MAYFNHAFKKTFLATGSTLSSVNVTDPLSGLTTAISTENGYLTTSNQPTYMLNLASAYAKDLYGPTEAGYIGIFDPKTNRSIRPSSCCNIYIAGSAIYNNDKIGPVHGGYTETNKSKMINPRYVQKFYRVDGCEGSNNVIHVGSTYGTVGGAALTFTDNADGTGYPNSATAVKYETTGSATGTGLTVTATVAAGVPTVVSILNPGKGYANGDVVTLVGGNNDATIDIDTVSEAFAPVLPNTECCREFMCGETYYLRVDVKGSPALRFLNHNAYYNAEAYTGCCPDGAIAPVAVDSTEVMIKWANALLGYELIAPFMQIAIQDEAGMIWYAPGSGAANTWDNYVSPGHVEGACAGLIINGAYVDTKFGNCTFQVSDFFEKQPVKIYASEVDLNGDPCAFEGICTAVECEGTQAQGLGEQVLRDVILSESYRQNFFASNDLRIREITQGDQMISAIDRNALYTKYYLLHSVPRFNNPTGVFDNDRYLLEIVTINELPTFQSNITDWLEGCGTECAVETFRCSECAPVISFF